MMPPMLMPPMLLKIMLIPLNLFIFPCAIARAIAIAKSPPTPKNNKINMNPNTDDPGVADDCAGCPCPL